MNKYLSKFNESEFTVKLKKIGNSNFYIETLTNKSYSIQDKASIINVLRTIEATVSDKNKIPFLKGITDPDVMIEYLKTEDELTLSVNLDKFKKLVNI